MQVGSDTRGKTIVAVCMVANNLTLGLPFGSFGALLALNEQYFGIARATISFGMSAFTVTMGLSALFMGGLVRRLTPRLALALGIAASGIAFLGLGLTSSLEIAFVMWALLGFGAAMAAILAPVAIAAEFFPDRSGRILGFVNLPVVLFVAPWIITKMLPTLGREGIYFAMASLLIPALVAALALPRTAAQTMTAHDRKDERATSRAMLRRADFWLITLGIALIAGTGVAFMVHAIPFARSGGLDASTAALILSIYSGAGLAGVPLFGWLADKIGPPVALALSAILQCLCWAALAMAPASSFLAIAALLGLATTPLTTLHGAAMARLFGAAVVGQAMGISFAIKLPFLFVISPTVGFLFTKLGDYRPAFLAISGCLLAAICLLVAGSTAAKRRGALRIADPVSV